MASHSDPDWLENLREQARVHLRFCAQLYHEQLSQGRYFLHEHPAAAASKEGCVVEIAALPNVHRIVTRMCQFGMKGPAVVFKPAGWMSNCPGILKQMDVTNMYANTTGNLYIRT